MLMEKLYRMTGCLHVCFCYWPHMLTGHFYWLYIWMYISIYIGNLCLYCSVLYDNPTALQLTNANGIFV